jgi:hypothetical protein
MKLKWVKTSNSGMWKLAVRGTTKYLATVYYTAGEGYLVNIHRTNRTVSLSQHNGTAESIQAAAANVILNEYNDMMADILEARLALATLVGIGV